MKIISYAILVLSVIFLGNTVKNELKFEYGNVLGDTNFWQQTDWSGGVVPNVISSDVNTFGTSENIKFDSPGVIQVAQKNDWATGMDSWKYRNKITINNTDAHLGLATETITDFPVIVKLENGVNFEHSLAKTNGEDLRFIDSDGTLLAHEIETWNLLGVSYVWVKISEIPQNSDTDNFFVYYGNDSATDNQQPQAVWSDNYLMVYHLNEPLATAGAGSVKDSTENTAGTPSSGVLFGQDGMIGKSTRFTGSTGISLGLLNNTLLTAETTISFWINSINIGTPSRQNPFGQAYGGWGTMTLEPNGTINWFFGSQGYDGSPYTNNTSLVILNQLNTWIHVTGVRDPDDFTYKWYKNGQFLNGGTYPSTYPVIQSKVFNIGDDYTNPINGRIDEFRVHSSARSASWIAANYKNETNDFLSYLPKENIIYDQGSLTSNIYDTGYPSDWGTIQFTKTGDVSVKVRTSNSSSMDGATDWTSCTGITSGALLSENNCVNDSERYIQYHVEILGSFEPIADLQDVTIGFSASDQIAPDVNASNITIQNLQNSGDWHPDVPVYEWTAGQDNLSGNGLLGYCLSIDEAVIDSSNMLDPALTGGILTALNDGVVQDYCPYIVTSANLNAETVDGFDFVTGKQYYISIKAVDIAGNIYNGDPTTWQDLISFKYDNTPPTAPFYISLPANFLSSKDVVITWPVGVGGADDVDSGLAGLQYRIGDAGTWYGDLHTGTQDITDLLINDGSYVTNETYDYPSLSEGNNLIYFRAIDNVGNVTLPENYVKGILKLNTVAPSPVRNLAVNPISGDENSYTFSWDVPSTYTGS
ncbi:MAG TPA: DUF2341 domain-containing protein, partial [Candidatus Woesebacteria bacterium]|nr:DUF2341 domain-containing protein [Candidatus Woesebacteria bacterium]